MNYIQVTSPITSLETKELMIALLADMGFEGFEEEGKQLKAFIAATDFSLEAVTDLFQRVSLSFEWTAIPSQNWNALWESNFSPVLVKQFCAIRAHFHEPITHVAYEIVITPKMSFGTGHHATTYLMIANMEALHFKQSAVFDFGTGTGVLAILAAKMGAASIEAIDNDDWSIENAKENILRNQCGQIQLYSSETIPAGKKFDYLLANINKHVILQHMPIFQQHLTKDGVVLLSGLLKEDEKDILDAAQKNGLVCTEVTEKSSWICMKMTRKQKEGL